MVAAIVRTRADMGSSDKPDAYAELDRRLVEATRGIRLLDSVSWPAAVEVGFVAAWKTGTAKLPEIVYPPVDFTATRAALDQITAAADLAHPLGDYIRRTADSWRIATDLLEAMGTPAVTEHSARLYGLPGDRVPGATLTPFVSAR
jgi:hypothetical protein